MNQESTIKMIETSFQCVAAHKEDLAREFYALLFDQNPQIKPLFDNTDMQKQGAKLYAALVLLVESLRQPNELQRILRPLGKKHIGYGATAEHYPMVGNALLGTLEKFLPDQWTPELGAAWANTLKEVTGIMLDGAGMTALAKPVPEEAAENLPSPVSGWLAPELMDVVEDSFASVKADKHAFSESFYKTLFEKSPQLKPLFANTDMAKQGAKLYATLVLLVENLRHPVELERVLLPLGAKHRAYGATAAHYPMVNRAILLTLEEYLGPQWTPRVASAWAETCVRVQGIMLRGASEGPLTTRGGGRAAPEEDRSAARDPDEERKARSSRPGMQARRARSLSDRFARWFYNTSLSTIIALWAVIGLTLITLSFVFPAIRGIAVFANPLSLLLALFLYIRETPERKKQFHYQAWSTIDNAAHVKSSNARFLALQDLCADGVSLKGLPLDGADLAGIQLEGTDLSSASLSECNLTDAVLCEADLNNVDLRAANLSGAVLSGANLGFAKLCGANCSSADFENANLMFADLGDANLSGAILRGAKLNGASLTGTYLSGADLRDTDVRREDLKGAFLVGATLPDGTIAQ